MLLKHSTTSANPSHSNNLTAFLRKHLPGPQENMLISWLTWRSKAVHSLISLLFVLGCIFKENK